MKQNKKQKNINKLLQNYQNSCNNLPQGEILPFAEEEKLFDGKQNITVYNPTKPIKKNGKKFLLGRVEPIDSHDSKAAFFVEENGEWQMFPHPTFKLEDPFYIENIHGFQILGGVETSPGYDGAINFRTIFYRYKNCATELIKNDKIKSPFAKSPWGMKDIRLVELKNGRIGVFTRPRGGKACLGKIAYIEIDSLDDLEKNIPRAEIISDLFYENEWGGANELHLLDNGRIGVLGHIAHFEGNIRHYYAMSFIFDPKTKGVSHMKIILTADSFPGVKSKEPTLGNIIFSGGLERDSKSNSANLYVGIGDTCAGCANITDPFAGVV